MSTLLPHVVNWNEGQKQKAILTLPAAPSRRPHQQPGRVDVQLPAQPVDQSGVSQQRPLEAQDGRLAGKGMEEVHPSVVTPPRLTQCLNSPIGDSNDLLSPALWEARRPQRPQVWLLLTEHNLFSRKPLVIWPKCAVGYHLCALIAEQSGSSPAPSNAFMRRYFYAEDLYLCKSRWPFTISGPVDLSCSATKERIVNRFMKRPCIFLERDTSICCPKVCLGMAAALVVHPEDGEWVGVFQQGTVKTLL